MARVNSIGGVILAVAMLAVGCAQSDPGITTAVKTKMAADDVVKAYRIDVDTNERVVTLTGSVDTAEAKQRAVQLARNTEGVRSVVDNLAIVPAAIPTTGIDDRLGDTADRARDAASEAGRSANERLDEARRDAGEAAERAGAVMTDATVTSAVKTRFLADPRVAGLNIDVDTSNGVVTLNGTLPSSAEKQRALLLARETTGVRSVVDRLKVAP